MLIQGLVSKWVRGSENKMCADQAEMLISPGLAGCRVCLPGDERYSPMCLWLPEPGLFSGEPCAAVAAGPALLLGAAPAKGHYCLGRFSDRQYCSESHPVSVSE